MRGWFFSLMTLILCSKMLIQYRKYHQKDALNIWYCHSFQENRNPFQIAFSCYFWENDIMNVILQHLFEIQATFPVLQNDHVLHNCHQIALINISPLPNHF